MPTEIDRAAACLIDAECGAATLETIDGLTVSTSIAEAYAIQTEARRRHHAAGRAVAGRKIGLTSPSAQAAFGASEPMQGALFSDTRLEPDAAVALDRLCAPRLEGEIAFRVGSAPDPAMDAATLAATIATVHAAYEIADSRVRDWNVRVAGLIADNACSGRFAIVEPGIPPGALVTGPIKMTVSAEGVSAPLSEGASADGLATPLSAYRWLVQALAAQGEALTTGDIVLTGALGPVVAMQPNTRYIVTIGELGTLRPTT